MHFAYYQIGLEKPNISIQWELDLQGWGPWAALEGAAELEVFLSPRPLSECFSKTQNQEMEDINPGLKFILKGLLEFCSSSKEQHKKLGPYNFRNLINTKKNKSKSEIQVRLNPMRAVSLIS